MTIVFRRLVGSLTYQRRPACLEWPSDKSKAEAVPSNARAQTRGIVRIKPPLYHLSNPAWAPLKIPKQEMIHDEENYTEEDC